MYKAGAASLYLYCNVYTMMINVIAPFCFYDMLCYNENDIDVTSQRYVTYNMTRLFVLRLLILCLLCAR